MSGTIKTTTNTDLANLLGNMDAQLASFGLIMGKIDTRLTVIENTTERIDKAIFGNGKPGLLEEHRDLKVLVDNHCRDAMRETEEKKVALDKKEKWGIKKWAVVVAIIGAFASNFIGLAILFIRTGTLH
jgi:hypothetical protein